MVKTEEGKKLTVLNADDFQYNLMVISNFCRFCGLDVVEAKNGLEALLEVEKFYAEKKRSFDFVFMDCDMPVMDGFEATYKINEFYEEKQILKPPIVAITANVLIEEIASKIKKSGLREILFKPLGIKKFKEILNKYLNINLCV
jgi:CheY-like chemotaxis protein